MSEDPTTPTTSDGAGGSRWVRLLGWAVVGAIVLVVLFTTVFPWIERNLSNPTLGG